MFRDFSDFILSLCLKRTVNFDERMVPSFLIATVTILERKKDQFASLKTNVQRIFKNFEQILEQAFWPTFRGVPGYSWRSRTKFRDDVLRNFSNLIWSLCLKRSVHFEECPDRCPVSSFSGKLWHLVKAPVLKSKVFKFRHKLLFSFPALCTFSFTFTFPFPFWL